MIQRRLSNAVAAAGIVAVLGVTSIVPAFGQDRIDRLERELNDSKDERERLGESLTELGDKKDSLDSDRGDLNASLEGLDEDITKKVTELRALQDDLPGAQQAVEDAEARVTAAQEEVNSLNNRVAEAEGRLAEIQAEIESSEQELEMAEEEVGQIAAEAYKTGGTNDLSFLLGVSDSSLPEAMGMAQQALRIQDNQIADVSQQNAQDVNSKARMEAVEAEIRELKSQAEDALEAEQTARDEANAAKEELDGMIDTNERLTAELEKERPKIESAIEENRAAADNVNEEILAQQEKVSQQSSEISSLEKEHEEAVAEAEAKRKAAEEAERKAREAEERAAREEATQKQKESATKARNDAKTADKEYEEQKERVSQVVANTGSSWGLIVPINSYQTSGFGWRPTPAGTYDYGGRGGYVHTGIDYGGGCGLPIKAARSGKVINADWAVSTSGRRVVIDHGSVNGSLLATKYHHMTRYVVSPGQQVSQGQVIGYTGTTGNSTGCHLHFETLINGEPRNPANYL